MTRFQKIMTGVYVVLYIAGAFIVFMDVFEWRAEPPKPSGAQVQAAEQAKAFAKGRRL